WRMLLQAMCDDPSQEVDALPLLDADERQTLLEAGSGLQAQPFEPMHRLFERVAADHPSRLALLADGVSMDYGSLDRLTSHWARHLAAHGVRRGERVVVCLPRSASTVVAALAVLKSGATLVPIDHDSPEDRLKQQLAELRPRVVLTTGSDGRRQTLVDCGVACIDLNHTPDPIDDAGEIDTPDALDPA